MIAKDYCEICKGFGPVGFTDCGLICEGCFNIEVQKQAFNAGVEASAKAAGEFDKPMAQMIRSLKKKTNVRENV